MARAIHIKKFGDGRYTPQEVHRMFAFPYGAKCTKCGGPPAVRGITMIPLADAVKRGMLVGMTREFVKSLVVPLRERTTDKKGAPYLRIGVAYSCVGCRKEFEKTLARAPSWAVVEISEGPNPTEKVVIAMS